MAKRSNIAIVISGLVLATLARAQMGGGMGHGMRGPGMMDHGMMGGSMRRHHYVMMNGIDPKYAQVRNPLPVSSENLAAGKALFEKNCSACHGVSGRGDGPAAKALDPAPADLAAAIRMPMSGDPYLYWTIAEGGAPVRSAMPSFKVNLTSDQIWKVVLYLRTL